MPARDRVRAIRDSEHYWIPPGGNNRREGRLLISTVSSYRLQLPLPNKFTNELAFHI